MLKKIPLANRRFNKFLKLKNLSQSYIASVSGVSRSNISQICNGRINISERFLISLMKEFNLNPEWIRHGKKPMIMPAKKLGVPIVADIPAGHWKYWIDLYTPGKADDYIFSSRIKGENLFGVNVKGDSMDPMLHDGDILIIDPDKRFIRGIAVVRHKNGFKIRNAYYSASNRLYLVPLNTKYKSEEIIIGDETHIYVPVKIISLKDI